MRLNRLALEPLEPRLMLSGDSTVVFNEIMYNPAGDTEETAEWIELHSQMAVDMDISAWSLAGGVQFEFPEGTIFPAGGYVVIAADPAALETASGYADARGPFFGRLSNGGERVELVNNNGRIMDAIDYGDAGEWPVGPDGSGASLAKFDPDSASGLAENWRTSMEVGGTPGRVNFTSGPVLGPEVSLLQIDAEWWYDGSGMDWGTTWKEVAFSPAAAGWKMGGGLLYDETAELPAPKTTPLTPGANTYYFRTEFQFDGDPNVTQLTVNHVIDDGAVFYLNGTEVYRFNMPSGPVSYHTEAAWAIKDATFSGTIPLPLAALVTGANVLAVEVHQAVTESFSGVTLLETGGDDGSGGVPDNLALQSHAAVAFAKDVLPGYPIHQIPHLNDGLFGNRNSWISNSVDSFAGVAFDQAYTIDRIAFGRDNGGEATQYTDRWGTYTLQYTTLADPDETTPDAAWNDIATLAYGGGVPDATPWLRHLWGFDPVDAVTGVRIRTHENGLCIDEIEVYEPEAPDIVFGTELTAVEILEPPSLLFNEVAGASDETFWLEIVNPGQSPKSAGGVVIAASSDNEYILPTQSIPVGGLVSFDETQLGFSASLDEKLYLYGSDRSTVLDAVGVENRLRGRSDQHRGRWLYPDAPTPGAPNSFELITDVVINEIMYHQFEPQPTGEAAEEWIELYNRGGSTVDLADWTIQDAIDFAFPAGTTIEPDGYLVVAKDADTLREKYPAGEYPDLNIIGNFSRNLSNRHDRILLVDSWGNPADEVHYYEGGRWSEFADGGGSSLELRDPEADNSKPEAWAASNEGSKSSWQTYSYRDVAHSDGGSTLYHEFVLGLLRAGEVLLDDISVIEFPDGARSEFIQNGTFESGAAEKWRILGTHQAQVVTDPENSANKVLHLIASGAGEDRLNHAETTLVGNTPITNGREYEISFRAKWLAGSNQVNTRLYFNRLAATTLINVPELNGTPGRPNSSLEANIGPTYSGLAHDPVVPDPAQPVTVSVTAEDPDGVDALTLWYSVNGGAAESAPMSELGGSLYQGVIPGQGSASVVQFYVEGEDGLGARSFFPAGGPDSRALYKVQDNQARDGLAHNFRIIMTAADTTLLHTPTNQLSNGRLGATVLYHESEVFYDVGVRLRGSNAGRANDAFVGFNVRFDPMQLFRGVHDTVVLDRSGRGNLVPLAQDEIVIKHMINHAGGIPGMYDDLVRLIAPNPVHTRSALLMMAYYGDEFLDSQFKDGADGTVFKLELQYVPNGTTDGNPESLKLPYPYNHPPPKDLANHGDDKEAYRWFLLIRNNRAEDDYSRMVDFCQAMSLSGSALAEAIQGVMDVDEWMRTFALLSLTGVGDVYTRSWHHNVLLYVRPEDDRVLAFPWDWDNASFSMSTSAPLVGPVSNLNKVTKLPGNLRLFYGHLLDIIHTTFNADYLSRWLDHYGSVAGQNFSPILNYINARRSFVLNNLPPSVPFQINTNSGDDFSIDSMVATLEGSGWIDVREIHLEGGAEPLDVTWTDDETWEVTVQLAPGANRFTFQAFDFQGNLVGTDSITVTNTVPERPLQEFLRITELNYNPYDPTEEELLLDPGSDNDDFEFIELTNIGRQTLDLTGAQFSDGIQFEFTAGYRGWPVLITEVGTYSSDYVEIQNVSAESAITAGWFVVVNDAHDVGQPPDIGAWHQTRWALPGEITAGEVLYRSDDEEDVDHYWGEDIFWRTDGPGWVMLVDDQGRVADFVVWGYSPAQIASLRLDINGFQPITVDAAWDGAAVEAGGSISNSLKRSGNSDHDDASDWAFTQPPSAGGQNEDLTTPFSGGRVDLDPGEFVVVVSDAAAFQTRYGRRKSIDLLGEYTGRLKNGGERVTLVDPFGGVIVDFQYDDGGSWPGRADGKGASLELIDPQAMPTTEPPRTTFLQDSTHWRSSSRYGGSPGFQGADPLGDVVVNELLSHTDFPVRDAIELRNTTAAPVDIGGWYLSDDWGWDPTGVNGNYKKFRIPDDTAIPAMGYVVFDEDDFNPGGGTEPTDFALSGAHGDDVWLMEADAAGKLTRFVDHVDFAAAANGESWGRWPDAEGDLYPMAELTLGRENTGPRVGPVIISEIHYNPNPGGNVDDLEFVEVYNNSPLSIDLANWRIRGAVDYDFPAGVSLDPFSPLLVVPFELSETEKLTAFYEAYWPGRQVPGDLVILGGYSGQLDDDGQRVQLQRPDQPPLFEPGFIPRLLEDEVRYDDEAPWPATPDGGGDSLHRTRTDAWGNTPSSWDARPPTPGVVEFPAEVVGRHIFYNNSTFDGNDPAAGAADDAAIAPDKEALLPSIPSEGDWDNPLSAGRARFANYTSYDRGINGIMIDVVRMPPGARPGPEDFQFHVGNDDDPAGWSPLPATPTIAVRPGDGLGGANRITLLWPDGAVQKQWLQVTVLPTPNTGLPEQDVFYFGSAIGETGNSTSDAKVNVFDLLGVRDNQRSFLNPAAIDFAYDFNRDARVNTYDMLIARDNQTSFLDALKLITMPDARMAGNAAQSDRRPAHDAVLEQAARRESDSGKTSSVRVTWLYEFEQPKSKERLSTSGNAVESALDALLAIDSR